MNIICSCGVRLDVVTVAENAIARVAGFADVPTMLHYDDLATRRPVEVNADGVYVFDNWLHARHGTRNGDGSALDYRCRKCRQHHTIRNTRLQAAVERAAAAGRTRLEFGIDL